MCSPNPFKVLTHHHIISGSYAASYSLGFGGTSLQRLQRPIGLGLSVSVSPLPRPPSGGCDLPGSPDEQGLEPAAEARLRQEDLERAGCPPGAVPSPHGPQWEPPRCLAGRAELLGWGWGPAVSSLQIV